jgi:hypothetical protein
MAAEVKQILLNEGIDVSGSSSSTIPYVAGPQVTKTVDFTVAGLTCNRTTSVLAGFGYASADSNGVWWLNGFIFATMSGSETSATFTLAGTTFDATYEQGGAVRNDQAAIKTTIDTGIITVTPDATTTNYGCSFHFKLKEEPTWADAALELLDASLHIANATQTVPGLVGILAQTFGGNKNFADFVGINRSSPDSQLHVHGKDGSYADGIKVSRNTQPNQAGYWNGIGGSFNMLSRLDSANGPFKWCGYNGTTETLYGGWDTNGDFYTPNDMSVGRSTPINANNKLSLKGKGATASTSTIYCQDSVDTATFIVDDSGTVYAVNTTIQSLSDKRLKKNIKPLKGSLSKLMLLDPSTWELRDKKSKGETTGFIADSVQKVFPEFVGESLAKKGYKTLGMSGTPMIAHLVSAMQEQQKQMDEMQGQIDKLVAALDAK